MTRESKAGFVFPFTLGTVFGVVSGAALGAFLGHRILTLVLAIGSLVGRHEEKEPPFDLLLQ